MPVIGMESEFNVLLDGKEIDPREYWGHPRSFIRDPLLPRERSSSHVRTGGAVYFDRGVIEVVTPVIELDSGATARMVRNLWEQVGYVRQQLDRWSAEHGHDVRLKGYSAHYNISFELPRSEQSPTRNVKSLALLLAYILPVPVMMLASNRRSTGVGVRPRGERIEITVDFTPDATLMVAAASLIVGIVRGVMEWPSYDLSMLDEVPSAVVQDVVPGPHTSRKGWLTKDHQYPCSPYTCDVDAVIWSARSGDQMSLRRMALATAMRFRHSIRRYSDPFSVRLLFAVLQGRAASLLDLPDRPAAYEDVGRACKWGMLIPEIASWSYATRGKSLGGWTSLDGPLDSHVAARSGERKRLKGLESADKAKAKTENGGMQTATPKPPPLAPDRRRKAAPRKNERRRSERRRENKPVPFPDRRLTRSGYERVFLMLVSGKPLQVGGKRYRPVGMRGWTHAIFRSDKDGSTRLLSIDQLLARLGDWN